MPPITFPREPNKFVGLIEHPPIRFSAGGEVGFKKDLIAFSVDLPNLACSRNVCSERYLFIRSEEHTSELQSRGHLVCRLLLEKKKNKIIKKFIIILQQIVKYSLSTLIIVYYTNFTLM